MRLVASCTHAADVWAPCRVQELFKRQCQTLIADSPWLSVYCAERACRFERGDADDYVGCWEREREVRGERVAPSLKRFAEPGAL